MTTTPTLALPNFKEPFTIETDASGEGTGVVLTQHERDSRNIKVVLVRLCKRNVSNSRCCTILETLPSWPYIFYQDRSEKSQVSYRAAHHYPRTIEIDVQALRI